VQEGNEEITEAWMNAVGGIDWVVMGFSCQGLSVANRGGARAAVPKKFSLFSRALRVVW